MAKHCETFDHTADVGLSARADSLAELFEALAEGLADVICPRRQVSDRQSRELTVEAEDVEALAVDFLSAVMVTMQTERFVVSAVKVTRAEENVVEARILGQPVDPASHEFHTEVKAVTYHQLRIAREDGGWAGRVLLDI